MRIVAMKDFAMQLTQKCVSMGLLDESYSEWFAYAKKHGLNSQQG
jgi:hypothetical protein